MLGQGRVQEGKVCHTSGTPYPSVAFKPLGSPQIPQFHSWGMVCCTSAVVGVCCGGRMGIFRGITTSVSGIES